MEAVGPIDRRHASECVMKRQFGFLLQLFVLTILPLLIYWQLQFGFRLVWMPSLLVVGMVLFWFGTRLRES